MIRTRKDVLNLPSGDDTLLWYGKAVAEMQKKLIADPTSWRYQAAIHEYTRSEDPHASRSDKLPSAAQQKKFWTQCQHGSWYFLPWHRMYLHFFEQIVLEEVTKLGGPKTWALPYWNYSPSSASALLPSSFRNPTLAGGKPNPLYVAQRDPRANAGKAFASTIDTDIQYCLMRMHFPGGMTGGSAGFAGPLTKFQHAGGTHGATEHAPHDLMHAAVGGASGWMDAFTTAPLDPIFWLHHCNIDRLWEVWIKRDPTHANPATANWLTSVSFSFHDAASSVVAMTPSQVLNTKATPLEYVYDDVSDPLPKTTPLHGILAVKPLPQSPAMRKARTKAVKAGAPDQSVPEMVGATPSPFRLDKGVVQQSISLRKPTGPAMMASAARSRRVFLHIEGITSKVRTAPYDVYVNLPQGADPKKHPELFAGRLPMFGLVETSRSDRKHGDNGLHYTLEITELYDRLAAATGEAAEKLRVSFVPTRPESGAGARVGRASVFFE